MRRLILSLALFLLPPPAAATPEALSIALGAARGGNAELAMEAAAAVDDPAGRDVVIWTLLRAREGDFADYVEFLERRADWPGLPLLRARGEASIPRGADPATVIAYFAPQPPRTGHGALRLAEALAAQGRQAEADAEIVRAWTTLVMTGDDARQILSRHETLLSDYHVARLDNLLWEGAEDRARGMLSLVPEGWQKLAEARLALQDRAPGVDARIAAVPEALAGDPGLAHDRFVWRMRAGLWDRATELLLERSASAETLGRPEEWARRRATLARDVMREGDFEAAYAIAANHHVNPEVDYLRFSDLEWLAGYAALRMGQADRAVEHFSRFADAVFSPISMGRAGYWLGRAQEAAGNAEAAAEAYAMGARFQSGFYGQLAAERGGLPPDPGFLGTEDHGSWREASFIESSVLRAALTLYQAGERDLAERFMTHLAESLTRQEIGQLADLAFDLDDPHIALMIAKRAAQAGHEIWRAYYPVTELAEADLPAPPELVLSIARRESEFDASVTSPAGAIGLMQVMPRTGEAQAERLDLPFSRERMLNDPDYNAALGAGYLAHLEEEFGPNPVLIAAAYNAGPSRAEAWIERFGDPRDPNVDIVDWIEAIPFDETRNYIMRVTESLAIYEAQLTGELPEIGLSERLQAR